jgi:anaerobic magnesium-protoporphyrin IX monomethyl ester cyclase
MRVLLVQPGQGGVYGKMEGLVHAYPPLGLMQIASILRKERSDYVKIVDLQVNKVPLSELPLLDEQWDAVGITSMTPTFSIALDVCRFIKKKNPRAKVIFGGPHVSAIPEELSKNREIDYLALGEADATIKELLDCIQDGGKGISGVRGIAYMEKGRVCVTPARPLIEDLDSIPFPAYDLIDLRNYSHPVQKREPFAIIITTRGCPGMCTFCCKDIFGRRIRIRSAKMVCDEMEALAKDYGVREIHIVDDTFTFIKKHAMDISREMIRRKLDLTWRCGVRADTVDYELLSTMKKAGCYNISVGVESGSQEVLDSVKKGITLEQVRRCFRLARKAGIETTAFFMIGFPEDTDKTIKETLDFSAEINADITKFTIVTPIPGSEMYEKLQEGNMLFAESWNDYRFHDKPIFRHKNLSPEEILIWYKKAYRSAYLRPRALLNMLKMVRNPLVLRRTLKSSKVVLRMMFGE